MVLARQHIKQCPRYMYMFHSLAYFIIHLYMPYNFKYEYARKLEVPFFSVLPSLDSESPCRDSESSVRNESRTGFRLQHPRDLTQYADSSTFMGISTEMAWDGLYNHKADCCSIYHNPVLIFKTWCHATWNGQDAGRKLYFCLTVFHHPSLNYYCNYHCLLALPSPHLAL